MWKTFVAEEVEQLLSYARQEFELNSKSGSDKASLREQLDSIKRQGGKLPEKYLELIECPTYLKDIWFAFLQLNSKRTSNGFGINPITYQDVLAYCQLKGVYLNPYEVDLIMQLDNICLEQYAKEQKQEQEKQKHSKQGRK